MVISEIVEKIFKIKEVIMFKNDKKLNYHYLIINYLEQIKES